MLFLGAGASKPFGIPTMKEFTEEIPKGMQKDDAQRVMDILARLKEFGFKDPDIESVMDVLNARENLNRAQKNIGPRIIEFMEKNVEHAENLLANVILERIKDQIQERCSKANFQLSDAYYKKFFQKVPTAFMGVGSVPTIFQHIFTTNYDLCIDKFLRGKTHYDGFADTMGYGRVFASEWPELSALNSEFTLCKLHGSINWFEVNGRATHLPFAPAQSLMEDTVTGRMMVYPATEKYALTSPYAECLFYFRRCLFSDTRNDPVVVIGYSFRDASINNAFVDAIKVNPNLKIISLRPQADAHQYDLELPLRSNVIPVDAKFGDDFAIEALRNTLT